MDLAITVRNKFETSFGRKTGILKEVLSFQESAQTPVPINLFALSKPCISRDFKQYARTPLGLEGSNYKKIKTSIHFHPKLRLAHCCCSRGGGRCSIIILPIAPLTLRMSGPASSGKMGKEVPSYWSYSTELPQKILQTRPEQKVEFQITQPMIRQCLMEQ